MVYKIDQAKLFTRALNYRFDFTGNSLVLCSDIYLSGFVVHVAVGEHLVNVVDGLFGTPIVVVLETPFDGAQIHGLGHNLEIIGQTQFDRVHRRVKGPAVLVFPHAYQAWKFILSHEVAANEMRRAFIAIPVTDFVKILPKRTGDKGC